MRSAPAFLKVGDFGKGFVVDNICNDIVSGTNEFSHILESQKGLVECHARWAGENTDTDTRIGQYSGLFQVTIWKKGVDGLL